jgi:hypothetical protein
MLTCRHSCKGECHVTVPPLCLKAVRQIPFSGSKTLLLQDAKCLAWTWHSKRHGEVLMHGPMGLTEPANRQSSYLWQCDKAPFKCSSGPVGNSQGLKQTLMRCLWPAVHITAFCAFRHMVDFFLGHVMSPRNVCATRIC